MATVIIFAATAVFVACKKEENQVIEHRMIEQNTDKLRKDLSKLNYSISQNVKISKTRKEGSGFWNKVKSVGESVCKACAVAGADAIGAATGVKAVAPVAAAVGAATGGTGGAIITGTAAVVCGVGASYEVGKVVYSKNLPPQNPLNIERDWDYMRVGEWHNLALQQYSELESGTISALVLQNIDNGIFEIEQDFLYSSDWDYIKSMLFNAEEWKMIEHDIQYDIQDFIEQELEIEQLLDKYSERGYLTPQMHEILISFFEIYLNIEELGDIKYVVQMYENFVNEVDFLSGEEKDALYVAFAVANHSPFYWIEFMEDIEE